MNKLSRKITFISLLRFTIPTILMMIAMSLYTMVDGIFVSRLINTSALSAISIVFPIIGIAAAIAIMFATGGSAVVATQMGEGKAIKAKENFTLIVITNIIIGVIFSAVCLIFLKHIIYALGANEAIFEYSYNYIFPILVFTPFAMLQMLFQYFFVTAGRPILALFVTIIAGLTNVVLDYVFIAICGMGIFGAGLATGIGYCIPAIFGLIYFFVKRKGTLCFIRPKFDINTLIKSSINGSSEMVTNLSSAVTTFLFNLMMMRYVGENGVAAITIVLYAAFMLAAIFLGYSSGVAPILSYNYGNQDNDKLKKTFKISLIFIAVSSVVMYIVSILASSLIIRVFAKGRIEVYDIAKDGFSLFAFAYIFMGINIFASAMFTAFSDGKVSAIISFLRTFVFITMAIMLLPQIIGINGLWLAVPFAEVLTLIVSLWYFVRLKTKYQYA